jgi:multidrug efflux pump
MSLPSLSIQRPVLAIVMNLIIMIFGYMGFKYLGIREYPAIDPPVVNVRTSYTGASSEVIEAQITEPLEKAINGIQGVRSVTSASNQGSSNITIEFNLDVEMETAASDVRDKVSQAVRQLPQDIDGPPVVSKADANSDAIISMTIQSDKRNVLEISDFAENVIAQRLQTIEGVSSVQIWGQKKYAMRLRLDPQKLAAYNTTLQDVKTALDRENVELPSGKLSGDQTDITVQTKARFMNADEFSQMIIRSNNGKVVRLMDVGFAELGAENEETILRTNGTPMIATALVPQPGANYIDIATEFYKRFEQLKKEVPEDYHLDIALDNTKFIIKSIEEVEETLLIAIVLVVLIIYLFFRDWSMAFRPLIDIPVSLIGTFFIMYLLGFSINVLTLLAIVLATGLVVDDGIVVTENIFKKSEEGLPPIQAAIVGSNEIIFAVVSTSITLAAIFMPIIFMQGFVGKLFREFGIVVASAVLISAFVSLTLTPMLNAYLVKGNSKKSKFYDMTEPFFVWLNNSYRSSLEGFMKSRWVAFLIVGLALGLTIFLWKFIPAELAPLDDRSMLRMNVVASEGASYDYTDHFIQKLGQTVKDSSPEAKMVLTVSAPSFAGSGAVNTGFVRIRLSEPSERKRTQQQIVDHLAKITKRFPDAKTLVAQDQTISMGGARGVQLPVQYVIQAPNFERLREVLPKFMEEVEKNPTFSMTDVNLKFNRPEVQIIIDRDKARSMGITVLDVVQSMQLGLSGQRFAYFTMNGKQYQVIGQFERSNRNEPLDLKSMYVKAASGQMVQLDNLVEMKEMGNPPQLYRYNRYVSATVTAGLVPGKTIGDGLKVMDEIKAKVLDESFSTALTGPSRDFAESSSNTMFVFLLALVLVYLILAAQFESFIDPFIIMLTVPLAVAGAIVSLWFFNKTMNIFSQIGMVMLIGLVTKNGILIVEFANHFKEQGKNKMEAAVEGAVARLRPILMTSIATALGALPIAVAFGAAAKSRMSMGIVIVGGLMISLIFTLYVIPAVYSYLSKEKKKHEEAIVPTV